MSLLDSPPPGSTDNEWVELAYALCAKDAESFKAAIDKLDDEERAVAIRILNDASSRPRAMSCVCTGAAMKIEQAMRAAVVALVAFGLAWASIPEARAQQGGLFSGCQAGFRACWDIGYYLNEETARRHRSRCTVVLNACQQQVRLAASGADYLDSVLCPRLSSYVYIARNGQSKLILRRGR